MTINRRSIIATAVFGTVAPSLVRAESLLDIPGDPLSARGLFAASKWASDEFNETPGCRLVFSDGQATQWMYYQHMSKPANNASKSGTRVYAVAIEAVVTDGTGARFVTSVPVDGVKASQSLMARRAEQDRQSCILNLKARRALLASMFASGG